MKPLTQDENTQALDQLIAAERQALARIKFQVQLHRDILNSPAETLTHLEASAAKGAQAVEWLEAQRETIAPRAQADGVRPSA